MDFIKFDSTISLGSILAALSVITGVMALYSRLVRMELKVETLWNRFILEVRKIGRTES